MLDKSPQQNVEFAAAAVRTLKSHIRQLHNFMFYKCPQQNVEFAAVAVRTLKSHIRQLHNFMFYKSPQPNVVATVILLTYKSKYNSGSFLFAQGCSC